MKKLLSLLTIFLLVFVGCGSDYQLKESEFESDGWIIGYYEVFTASSFPENYEDAAASEFYEDVVAIPANGYEYLVVQVEIKPTDTATELDPNNFYVEGPGGTYDRIEDDFLATTDYSRFRTEIITEDEMKTYVGYMAFEIPEGNEIEDFSLGYNGNNTQLKYTPSLEDRYQTPGDETEDSE